MHSEQPARQPMLYRPGIMRRNSQVFIKNAILARVSLQDLAVIGGFLEPIILRERMILQELKKNPDYVYFIEAGLVSLRIVAAGSILEVATIGYRGAVGASALLGTHLSTHQAIVLVAGSAHRVRVEDLRRITNERPDVKEQLYRYAEALALHCAQTGLCGVRHDREKRLASWLCLARDALDANVLPVTHEYLSSVLALRRAGITETLIRFEEQRLISKMRGVLQIDDYQCLRGRACSCYNLISGAYTSLETRTEGKRPPG
ncbi:Crp/Fnr family transcriptional regulator [Bradyrhizobium sp. USDA 4506]